MSRHNARVGTLAIPNAGSNSPAISSLEFGKKALGQAFRLTIHGPAALTAAVTVEVQTPADATWRTLQEAGADVAIAAGKSRSIEMTGFSDLRLHSAGAEAAQRDFPIDAEVDTTSS